MPARIGGEEFAIWLPGATLDLGKRIAERVRIKLGTTAWEWQGQALAPECLVRGRGVSGDEQ